MEVIQLGLNSTDWDLAEPNFSIFKADYSQGIKQLITGCSPSNFKYIPELKVIDLGPDHLNGSLLPSFFMSTKLTDLNLSGNNFIGATPIQDIKNMPSVSYAENLSLVTLDLS